MVERAQIIVKGVVQGVGFRPSVYKLATSLQLAGYVTNTSEGVLIEVEGTGIPEFVRRLRTEAPPLSDITEISITNLPVQGDAEFNIRASTDHAADQPFTLVSPDVSICDDCLREMLDPADRRYLYPFINCTNCGPRYSITTSVPYDRPNTTMAVFTMCPDCLREYQDPGDRRFHAQPNACPVCGPQVEFRMRNAECGMRDDEAIRATIDLLQKGGIVAIKGLGGFHIACDAANDETVRRLRENKRKSNKPFAMMSLSIEDITQFCMVSGKEGNLLRSNRRPVVLLQKQIGSHLSEAVSPNNRYVGVMLPYTPLHHLLFTHPVGEGSAADRSHFKALVMTSGNLSEEPIVRDNDEAVRKLSGMVDGFLFHDRNIFMRVDDSVVRILDCGLRISDSKQNKTDHSSDPKQSAIRNPKSAISFIRRSRGYAPGPIALRDDGPEVLGVGADLKNTFTLTKGRFAIPSQHIGDMENYETVKFFEECLANLKSVYRAEPVAIVHDLHPAYVSTQWAIEFAIRNQKSEMKRFALQHHYAHIGSVMAEHGLTNKVIGIAFDGTGYGTDGNLWGGEFLVADCDGFERVGQFKYIPLPGGEAAIREPWKTAVSYIIEIKGSDAGAILEEVRFIKKYGAREIEQLMIIARSRDFSPLSSGAGRLFDAISALIGVCDHNTFEGEAAMALESLTREGIDDEYVVELKQENGYTVLDFSGTIGGIVRDMSRKKPKEEISTKFHNTIASIIRTMVRRLKEAYGIADVALSGGTFQNLYLLNRTILLLSRDGMNVYRNQKVPCNDACISLGQAYLIRQRLRNCGMPNAEREI
jgi:hydrogenase maturation protein HypF